MSDKPRLGYIGIGVMGRPMTLRLLAAGYKVAVWNRSRDKLPSVVEKGAQPVDSPAAAGSAADVLMMCVTDQKSVEEILFGPNGVAAGAAKGTLVVDFSSIAPACARVFAARLLERGIGFVDAPVSGGVSGAEKGTLAIMAGGREQDVERARPVVTHLAARFTRMGDSGAGQATKLCNQIIVGSTIALIAEAVRFAEASGVDPRMLPEALKGGFADSLPLQIFGPRMAARTFEPFLGALSIMLKDLDNAGAQAKEQGVPLAVTRAATELYRLHAAHGNAARDISTLVELLGPSRQ
jgi:3-hydroxyisobutyrate dehydrogenase